jgi:GTP-binding protein
MSLPLVAIVGRPNVGKSMLFNRLVGKRVSIVEDTPGVTRDRIYAECEWSGRRFDLVDTGGIEPKTDDEMLLFMREQAYIAIDTSDVIILVTDIHTGVTAADKEVADMLLRSAKPIVLAVNKCDTAGPPPPELYEFYNLGIGDPFAVSAFHGLGTGDLLDECVKHFPSEQEVEDDEGLINVAIIGKPNVGKSSLLNEILGVECIRRAYYRNLGKINVVLDALMGYNYL